MLNRREFLKVSALGATAMAGGMSIGAAGANERVVAAVVGIRDRGMDLARELAGLPGVSVRYLADPDSRLFEERARELEEKTGARPECVQDFRRVLDDPEVNALAIATPDHWHALATIWACQAGKDVYVEKPTSHSIWESRQMVEAARKYGRVVQVGLQNRSAEYIHSAVEYVQSADFGGIHFVRVLNSKARESIGHKPDMPTPDGVDYDLWLGPAPSRPFNENHFHYNWHWFWRYGGGDLANDGVHQIDLARWLTGRTLPEAVSAAGGIFHFKDDRETPDTQTVTWEYDGLSIVCEQTLWTPYMKKVAFELRDTDTLPSWPFAGTSIQIYGTRQMMYLARMGGGWQVFDADGQSVRITHGRFAPANTAHMANFVECVRTRAVPSADIEDGHYSTLLAHYGNLAYRAGRRLRIDPATEGFLDDPDAQSWVRRDYRAPYIVPGQV